MSIKWIVLVAVVGLLAWRAVARDRPETLLQGAYELRRSDPAQAEQMLRQAAWADPTDGRIYLLLASLREPTAPESAQTLASAGARLAPKRLVTQLAAAAFWVRQGKLEQALVAWSTALELHPLLRQQLYPVLLRLADDPQQRPLLQALLATWPNWWADFYGYVAANAADLDTVRLLYRWRQASSGEVSDAERQALLARLERDSQWREAYFVWLNGLDLDDLSALGTLYNGDFERPLGGTGFGWRIQEGSGATIEAGFAYGAKGEKALSVAFAGAPLLFQHVFQHLLLPPGAYQLRGFARSLNLSTTDGLRWQLRCIAGSSLGNSRRFAGSLGWQAFSLDFTVPDQGCEAQELRLAMVDAEPRAVQGELWFDELSVRPLAVARFSGAQ